MVGTENRKRFPSSCKKRSDMRVSSFNFICTLSILLLTILLGNAHAATLQIDGNGELYGISDVEVNGLLYDVEFVDGSFMDLFFDGSDFIHLFTTQDDAYAASMALLTLIDTIPEYDEAPSKIVGIEKELFVAQADLGDALDDRPVFSALLVFLQ